MKNPAHLDNFKSSRGNRFAVIDITTSPVGGTQIFEIASGKNEDEATRRFVARFNIRGASCRTEREWFIKAQTGGRLRLVKMDGASMTMVKFDFRPLSV